MALAVLLALTAVGCGAPRDARQSHASATAVHSFVPPPTLPAPVAPVGPTSAHPVVMAASVPVRIEIPAIAVDSELMELGLLEDGTLEVPPSAFPAGWFTGGPTPGELGPAVIAGHIDWSNEVGVFRRLGSVTVGDEIRITRADGTVAVFRTVLVGQYPKDAFPTDLVYGNIDHAALRLVSCGGELNRATDHYEDNIVVFADLMS